MSLTSQQLPVHVLFKDGGWCSISQCKNLRSRPIRIQKDKPRLQPQRQRRGVSERPNSLSPDRPGAKPSKGFGGGRRAGPGTLYLQWDDHHEDLLVFIRKDVLNESIVNAGSSVSAANYTQNSYVSEAMEALMVLGYDKSTVLSIVKEIDHSITDSGEIIRQALKKLAR